MEAGNSFNGTIPFKSIPQWMANVRSSFGRNFQVNSPLRPYLWWPHLLLPLYSPQNIYINVCSCPSSLIRTPCHFSSGTVVFHEGCGFVIFATSRASSTSAGSDEPRMWPLWEPLESAQQMRGNAREMKGCTRLLGYVNKRSERRKNMNS